jgi:uncharacterized protein GlcG (DUF336 family)
MRIARLVLFVVAAVKLFTVASAHAQALPYGAAITLEQARKAVTGAEAEARKNNWNVVIAIVDTGGNLVLLQRMDNAQFGSIEVAR